MSAPLTIDDVPGDASSECHDWRAMIAIGRIARTHGRRGEVVIDSDTDFPERRFRPGGDIYVAVANGVTALRITSARIQRGRPIVGIAGFESITDAQSLAGKELRIPRAEQQSLPDGSYYTHALMGCEVRTRDDDVVGIVTDVEHAGGISRLLVRQAGGDDEIDIPLVDPICVQVDTAAKVVVVDPPEGLLELNRR
jgi:16S rRNA processing protein RimM